MRARGPVTGFIAAALVLLSTVAFIVPDGKAVVTGGIIPCSGLEIRGGPHYASGTVTVLVGEVPWTGRVVAQQRVGTNEAYRFVLEPGQYVIRAGNAYTSVRLQPSDDVYIDVPNVCI